ncbi:MAG: 50S ribosomal protein L23 [Gammaproteobacteria bacterium]
MALRKKAKDSSEKVNEVINSQEIILGQHITEKATMVNQLANQNVFKVSLAANKHQIKDAIEKQFNVVVESVRTCNVKRGPKKTPIYKKAYVTLQQGQSINISENS